MILQFRLNCYFLLDFLKRDNEDASKEIAFRSRGPFLEAPGNYRAR